MRFKGPACRTFFGELMANVNQDGPGNIKIGARRYPIRSIDYNDAEVLHQLDALCFPAERAFTEGYFLLLFFYEDAYGWLLEDKERVVAFILLTSRRKRVNIATIDVHPNYRRRGIGSTLLEFAEEHARQEGTTTMTLQVETTNTSAIRLYHRHGYEKVRVLSNYYADADAWQMRKQLN